MKIRPVFLTGLMFVAIFLSLIQISKMTGVWSQRSKEGHGFSDKPPEIMKLGELIKTARLDSDCVFKALGIDKSQTEMTIKDLSTTTGMNPRELIEKAMECRTGEGEIEDRGSHGSDED